MYDDAAYYNRALQLADAMRAHCGRSSNGELVLHPANENGFSDPCDALARLGVMKPYSVREPRRIWKPGDRFREISVLAYEIHYDWSPDHPLNLQRHPGEPSYYDLLRALCQQGWFHGISFRELGIDYQTGRLESDFIDDLVARGFGSWSIDTGFVFDKDRPGCGWEAVSQDYHSSWLNLANKLGSEEALFPPVVE
jgi:hypothetical protein